MTASTPTPEDVAKAKAYADWWVSRPYVPDPALHVITLRDALTASEAREAALREAVLWALGCRDDFPPRGDKQGAYWWRTELAKRAGITNDDMTCAALVTP